MRVDSDVPLAELSAACGGERRQATLSGGNVARVTGVTPGRCTVTLSGTVPMSATLELAGVGSQLTCRFRGGSVACS